MTSHKGISQKKMTLNNLNNHQLVSLFFKLQFFSFSHVTSSHNCGAKGAAGHRKGLKGKGEEGRGEEMRRRDERKEIRDERKERRDDIK